MNRWLYLHAPQLLLEAQLAQQDPTQAAQPQALLLGSRVGARQVVQCNQAAAAQGLRLGMAEVTASTLVPTLQMRRYDAAQEQRLLHQLAQWCYQDIAQIALYPPQGLLFEWASVSRLYGGFAQVVAQLQQRLQAWSLTVVLASADTPLRAQLLAQAGVMVLDPEPAVAQAALAQLPISASGLAPRVIERLQQVGISTLGALQQRSAAALGARFGAEITHYLARLQGQQPSPQQFYRPPAVFYQALDLLAEVTSWPQLWFPLKRLLQQLEAFLQARQASIRSLRLLTKQRDGKQQPQTFRFAHPLWQSKTMLGLLQLQLEQQQLSQPALALALQADQLEPRQVQHDDWVQTNAAGVPPRGSWVELIARLQARLGEQAVQQPRLQREWRPHLQQQWQAWQQHSKSADLMPVRTRPLWLLPEAQPIDAQQWQLQWGPERLQSGWWDDQLLQRDYFIALDPQQRQGWIYRDQQGWFLHGWFS